jgi:hypothetical protein
MLEDFCVVIERDHIVTWNKPDASIPEMAKNKTFLCSEIYSPHQRNLSIPGNIISERVLKKLAHMFKRPFNYCARNCSQLMSIARSQLEDAISWESKIAKFAKWFSTVKTRFEKTRSNLTSLNHSNSWLDWYSNGNSNLKIFFFYSSVSHKKWAGPKI